MFTCHITYCPTLLLKRMSDYIVMYLLLYAFTDTLGIFARTIGNENFLPMARESMNLGIQLINKTNDPDLRKSAYGLFASVSSVLKQDMAGYLPTIMEVIIKAITNDSGVAVSVLFCYILFKCNWKT